MPTANKTAVQISQDNTKPVQPVLLQQLKSGNEASKTQTYGTDLKLSQSIKPNQTISEGIIN